MLRVKTESGRILSLKKNKYNGYDVYNGSDYFFKKKLGTIMKSKQKGYFGTKNFKTLKRNTKKGIFNIF